MNTSYSLEINCHDENTDISHELLCVSPNKQRAMETMEELFPKPKWRSRSVQYEGGLSWHLSLAVGRSDCWPHFLLL